MDTNKLQITVATYRLIILTMQCSQSLLSLQSSLAHHNSQVVLYIQVRRLVRGAQWVLEVPGDVKTKQELRITINV